jgi:hypothetical protein
MKNSCRQRLQSRTDKLCPAQFGIWLLVITLLPLAYVRVRAAIKERYFPIRGPTIQSIQSSTPPRNQRYFHVIHINNLGNVDNVERLIRNHCKSTNRFHKMTKIQKSATHVISNVPSRWTLAPCRTCPSPRPSKGQGEGFLAPRTAVLQLPFEFEFEGRPTQNSVMTLDQDRVPISLDEALDLLNSALAPNEKAAWTSMTAARMFDLQARIARILRNDWSLDDANGPLRIYFRELGLDDPEEVSLLLIDAYWRKYNNQALPVEELVREYLEG